MTETVIDLIRHGEPVGGRLYRGHTLDDPLTEKGWMQMWQAVGDYNAWDRIITSPLERCRAFAYALGAQKDIQVTIEPRFKEVGFGVWEGLSHDQIKIHRSEEYEAFLKDPVNQRPTGAENLDEFIQRVSIAHQELSTRYHGQHCLIVSHAGVIRAVVANTVQAASTGLYRIKINNGGITRIRHTSSQGAILEFLNGMLSD